VAQVDGGLAAGLAYISGLNQLGGGFVSGLYRPMALLTVAVLGGSAAGVGVASAFSADTQA